jgi:hypothetical protein
MLNEITKLEAEALAEFVEERLYKAHDVPPDNCGDVAVCPEAHFHKSALENVRENQTLLKKIDAIIKQMADADSRQVTITIGTPAGCYLCNSALGMVYGGGKRNLMCSNRDCPEFNKVQYQSI